MGQVALGFRSLLIKATIFFVMAVLLAWALGGTLWPRAEVVDLEPVTFAGREWFWRMSAGGREPGMLRWRLMTRDADLRPVTVGEGVYRRVAMPVATPEAVYFAGCPSFAGDAPWRVERIDAGGGHTALTLPDRLAVEQQLARVRVGLAVQEVAEIERQRERVLDPDAAESAAAVP